MNRRHHIAAAAFFAAATLALTWPLAARLGSAVTGAGDPLLNAWILAWDAHRLGGGGSGPFFDANIFHPYPRTLAWSEHLLPQALVAWPVRALGGNPIAAHNFVLLLAFATSGLGMYALARSLTGSTAAGLVAGVVFAFPPFMFSHVAHLQVVSAAGIPLSFWFLGRYFDRERWRDLAGFALAFTAQILANGYYALFLGFGVGLFGVTAAIEGGGWARRRFWVQMLTAGVFVGAVAGPVLWQYLAVRGEIEFVRPIVAEASWRSFLATPAPNRLYGELTRSLARPERELFPGVVALSLAAVGLCSRFPRKRTYLAIGALALLFSFGTRGPYLLLQSLPGFDGVRAVTRWHVLTTFVLALFAAFGFQRLARRLGTPGRSALAAVVLAALFAEYVSAPIPLAEVPVGDRVPPVYRWLDEHTEPDAVVIELPLPAPGEIVCSLECLRVYFSSHHFRRLVNGYSGFVPPVYRRLQESWHGGSLDENGLRALGVDYVIVHARELGADERPAFTRRLRPVGRFGSDVVFALGEPGPRPRGDPAPDLSPPAPGSAAAGASDSSGAGAPAHRPASRR